MMGRALSLTKSRIFLLGTVLSIGFGAALFAPRSICVSAEPIGRAEAAPINAAPDAIIRFTELDPIGEETSGKSVGMAHEVVIASESAGAAAPGSPRLSATKDELVVSWENLNVQAALVDGFRLRAQGSVPDRALITWTTNHGASVDETAPLTDWKRNGSFRTHDVMLQKNQNWRDSVTSLRIALPTPESSFLVDSIQLLPSDLAGRSSRIRVDGTLGDCMVQMAPYKYSFRIAPPPSPILSFGVRTLGTEFGEAAEATFSVEARPSGGEEWEAVFTKRVASSDEIAFFNVPLQAVGDRSLEIRFRVHDEDGAAAGIWHTPFVYSARQELRERPNGILYIGSSRGFVGKKKGVSS